MKTNLNTEPTKQDQDQTKSETDQAIARAEKARLEALRSFYRFTKRLADSRARDR